MAERLGRDARRCPLLVRAMAHRSWCAEHLGQEPNERLEFLGDSVLSLVVTGYIYTAYPDLAEGDLAKVRAAVVNSEALAEVAAALDLGAALLLGKGEDASGGREKLSILADALEAVIGAIYLDEGWDAAAGLVMGWLGSRILDAAAGPGGRDYKTRLQEAAALVADQLPTYELEGMGPDHAKRFRAQVFVDGRCLGRGEGRSKKQAQQEAARMAWRALARSAPPNARTLSAQPDWQAQRRLPAQPALRDGRDA